MAGLLQDRVAAITGSGRGIGRETACLFAREGAKVVVHDVDEGPAQETADLIQQAGGQCLVVVGDVTDPSFPERLVRETIGHWKAIHVLVNNAGYTWDGMLHKMPDEQWEAMLTLHMTAPFRLLRAFAPFFRDAAREENKQGIIINRKIINISSLSGFRGMIGQANYAAAKAGMLGLTRTLAKEWADFHVQVNIVAFGWIDTRLTAEKEKNPVVKRPDGKEIPIGIFNAARDSIPMLVPAGRAGTVEEASGPLLFLASSMSDYITGQCLEVAGGA
ncbi:SDR family oxidoreductase [bacterium]|nr:SDR family oxidoreductase [bacterium]